MNNWTRGILAVLGGIIVGSTINMLIINLGPKIIAPPAGYDLTKIEGLKAAMAVMTPKHFVFPFLAHAFGSLSGALAASMIATKRQLQLSLFIGGWFMAGGIAMILMLPSPIWFNALDLLFAYFPAAFVGHKLVTKNDKN